MRLYQNKATATRLVALIICLFSSALASDEGNKPAAQYPALSSDGTRLVYVSNDSGGTRDLWIADSNGANPSILTPWPSSDEKHPSWAPNAGRIVFSSNRGSSKHQIWVINSDGTNALQLTSDDAEHEYPRYSPDGLSILYLSNATGKRELWVMAANGTAQHSIALIGTRVSDPSWSPDGSEIVYVGCRRNGECNLFRINANGSGGSQITIGDFQDWNPDWGPRGILFASNRGGSQGLWLVQADGSDLVQVTAPVGVADLDPRWIGATNGFVFSRSGKSVTDGASDIWLITALGTDAAQITRVSSPLSIKRGVMIELTLVRADLDERSEVRNVDSALEYLRKSIDSGLWVDASHLQPITGNQVFNQEKDAVNKLRELLKTPNGSTDTLVRGLIRRLVLADRLLLEIAIADAEARGSDRNGLAKAKEELELGNTDEGNDRPVNAIEHYRNGWTHALKPRTDGIALTKHIRRLPSPVSGTESKPATLCFNPLIV